MPAPNTPAPNRPSPDDLIDRMSLSEKVRMLSGDSDFWPGFKALLREDSYHTAPFPAAVCERLGLGGLHFIDGPRGVVLKGGATTFPVSMARGASWDTELEERVGDAIGRELRSHGGNLFGGICINLLRHPAWGRAQETYGEDTLHLGAMGAALTRGVQRHAAGCVKHYALNSMENARFTVDVRCAPRPLHEVYLPHFKDCVDAGAQVVMSAYNAVNGEWAGQSHDLLTDILKERWGFEGVVLTDFVFGMRDAKTALDAGQDLEMPFRMVWGERLEKRIRKGEIAEDALRPALRRLIAVQRDIPEGDYSRGDYPESVRACAEHIALAREAAQKSILLLKNDGLLPLASPARVVMLGPLARQPNLGDHGSSDGRPAYAVTPVEGLRAALDGDNMGEDAVAQFDTLDAPGAREAVAGADAVIAVVGYTHEDEGEYIAPLDVDAFAGLIPPPRALRWMDRGPLKPVWNVVLKRLLKLGNKKAASEIDGGEATFGRGGDRASLDLSARDEAVIREASALNANTAVTVMAGSAVTMENWKADPAAILMLWYPGMEGGHALADILLGKVNPSARLPFSIPTSAAHLPEFDRDATFITYGLWHGYRMLDRDGHAPAYPFGFGLSYTSFALSDFRAELSGDVVEATFEVRNTGGTDGACVVQLYMGLPGSRVERAPRELKGFTRIDVPAGETVSGRIRVPKAKFAYFDEARDGFVIEPGAYRLELAQYAGDPEAQTATLSLD